MEMNMKRLLTAGLLAGLMAATPAAARQVKPAWDGITEELFQTLVVVQGLKALGMDVGPVNQLQVQLAHLAVGSGDVDFYAAHWVPLHNSFFEEAGGEKKLHRAGTLASNSIQGYLIDKKTADAQGIKYLEDLADPKKAKLFDIDGNGKADLYGCDPGWGCERTIEFHLGAYNLRSTVEQKEGSYFAIIPDAIERIKAGKPTLYYTWTPQWVSAVLRPGQEVVWLNVKTTRLPEGETGNTTVEGLGNLGFTVNTQTVIANNGFLQQNPQAKRFFELLKLSIEDINAENLLVSKGEKSDDQILGHAKAWIAKHQNEWDAWIAEAKAAK